MYWQVEQLTVDLTYVKFVGRNERLLARVPSVVMSGFGNLFGSDYEEGMRAGDNHASNASAADRPHDDGIAEGDAPLLGNGGDVDALLGGGAKSLDHEDESGG